MSDIEYHLDLVSVFPDTQLLIVRFLDKELSDDFMYEFASKIKETFKDNDNLRVMVTSHDFDIETLDVEELASIGLFSRDSMEAIDTGEMCALSLAVDLDELPLHKISEALRLGDLEALEDIKKELLAKVQVGKCPVCGSLST